MRIDGARDRRRRNTERAAAAQCNGISAGTRRSALARWRVVQVGFVGRVDGVDLRVDSAYPSRPPRMCAVASVVSGSVRKSALPLEQFAGAE